MISSVNVNLKHIQTLDLTPVTSEIEPLLQEQKIASAEQKLSFVIDYPREDSDPRELSEIPEVRLWFVRLDATYPWLPFVLNWQNGELARYASMLVPHQFKRNEGIEYNPEALEIFAMHKAFILIDWLKQWGINSNSRVKAMLQMFGYEIDEAFLRSLISG